jgi:hypothetical protein
MSNSAGGEKAGIVEPTIPVGSAAYGLAHPLVLHWR